MNPGIQMNWLSTVLVLAAAFAAVFWETAFGGLRHLLGAQIDLLPGLMVYAALNGGLKTVCLLGACGGLWFDSLSANPLGVSILPLFLIGLATYQARDMVLREQAFAQAVLGLAASMLMPLIVLLALLTTGKAPLFGWGTLWQLLVMSLGGAVATPIFFVLFEWLQHQLVHQRASEPSFRPDREIRRGR